MRQGIARDPIQAVRALRELQVPPDVRLLPRQLVHHLRFSAMAGTRRDQRLREQEHARRRQEGPLRRRAVNDSPRGGAQPQARAGGVHVRARPRAKPCIEQQA
jgi:hypothetical protein